MQPVPELLRRDRLDQIALYLQAGSVLDSLPISQRRDHDHGDIAQRMIGVVTQALDKLQPTHRFHADVAEHQVRFVNADQMQGRLAILPLRDVELADGP